MKKSRTPQEKKSLSYAKDRRNAYGENNKSSRKSIRVRKKLTAQTKRRSAHQALALTSSSVCADDWAAKEIEASDTHGGSWRKDPDKPLGDLVKKKLARRKGAGIGRSNPTP